MNKPPFWAVLVSSGLGTGYSPVAPGTVGALLAVLLWVVLLQWLVCDTFWLITLLLISIWSVLSVRATNAVLPYWGKDPSRVVSDEMVGVWIPLLAVPCEGKWEMVGAAFLLFRFFDIVKPFGIRAMEKLPRGIGVLMDDVLAGLYSLVLLLLWRFLIG